VRRAHASNKTVDPYAIYKSTVAHIQQVTKNRNPLKINILQEELEPILKKKQDGGVLDDKEQLMLGQGSNVNIELCFNEEETYLATMGQLPEKVSKLWLHVKEPALLIKELSKVMS
jgi:hypothetical protein